MLSRIFLLLPVIFALPGLHMQWVGKDQQSVAISFDEVDARWEQCVQSGLQAKYRMEIKLCRRRSYWPDQCLDPLVATRSIEKDLISGTYKVRSDILSDPEDPEAQGAETYSDALRTMLIPLEVSFARLSRTEPAFMGKKKIYLRARAISACRGEVSPVLRRFSQFLSLGLLDLQDRSSGWVDFRIN